MKKLFVLFFLVAGYWLSGCGNNETATNESAADSASQALLFTGPLGVQAYTFRNSGSDPVKILDTIKSLGFSEIEGEIKGNKPDGKPYSQQEIIKLIEDRSLKTVSIGIGYKQLLNDDSVRKVVSVAKRLGATYIMCAWIDHGKGFTKDDADRAAKVFNNAGKLMKDSGITFAYHCHGYEFQPYEDGTIFDYLAKSTSPEYVTFEVDILWAFFGGQDPAALIDKYGSRCTLLRVKDLKKGVQGDSTGKTDVRNDVAVGTGQLDIPAIMKAARKAGVKHYFIEDESPLHAEQMPVSIKNLRELKE